jgi:hypothetical protein
LRNGPYQGATPAAKHQVADLCQLVDASAAPVILGCGVEPDLAEIMACHPAEKLN